MDWSVTNKYALLGSFICMLLQAMSKVMSQHSYGMCEVIYFYIVDETEVGVIVMIHTFLLICGLQDLVLNQ
jgi:hypothetical protein